MLERKPNQARYQFDIPGITYEVTFTDFFARSSGGDSDEDGGLHLDRAQFSLSKSDCMNCEDHETFQGLDEFEMFAIQAEAIDDPNADNDAEVARNARHKLLHEAVGTLTDKQTQALWLYSIGFSGSDAAECLGITQATYHEAIHGKGGIGGALRKIRKYFENNDTL